MNGDRIVLDFADIYNELNKIENKCTKTPPSKNEVVTIIKRIQNLFFPEYYPEYSQNNSVESIYYSICSEVCKACTFAEISDMDCSEIAFDIVKTLLIYFVYVMWIIS